jgi:hypothetical protein
MNSKVTNIRSGTIEELKESSTKTVDRLLVEIIGNIHHILSNEENAKKLDAENVSPFSFIGCLSTNLVINLLSDLIFDEPKETRIKIVKNIAEQISSMVLSGWEKIEASICQNPDDVVH